MKGLTLVFLIIGSAVYAQTITGKWITVDDNTGQQRSVVDIYEKEGKLYGKVVMIFTRPGEDPDPVCDKCDPVDVRHKEKVIGMEIIRNMVRSGEAYEGGDILDPEVGKVYRCKLWIEEKSLKVRGYWGPFYRTQTWKRDI